MCLGSAGKGPSVRGEGAAPRAGWGVRHRLSPSSNDIIIDSNHCRALARGSKGRFLRWTSRAQNIRVCAGEFEQGDGQAGMGQKCYTEDLEIGCN